MEIIVLKDVEIFIASLEERTIAKVLRTIDLLERFGYRLGIPHSKKIDRDLFELRVRGQQEVRIFYVFKQGAIILIHGFIKKSQKIPKREIKVAQEKLRLI
jgi:phage-related protein